MLHKTLADIPAAQIDQYDTHQKHAFIEALNHAFDEYQGDEGKAYAVAHSAAKQAGRKEAREKD